MSQEEPGRRRFGPTRAELTTALELWAVTGLAVVQPTLDLLGKNLGVFLMADAGSIEIVLVALGITLIPTLALYMFEVLLGLVAPRVRPVTHAVLIGSLAGLFVTQLVAKMTGATPVAVTAGIAAAVTMTVLAARVRVTHTFLRYLAIAPVLFVLLFVTASPASKLAFSDAPTSVAGTTISRPHRVVMVVLDELPLGALLDGSGHVDAGLYPGFAELAAASTWYRNTSTVHGFTEWAVPAVLSGNLPTDPEASPSAADYPDTVFRLLGGAYRMNVHETVTHLCPTSICIAPRTGRGTVGTVVHLLREAADLWTASLTDPDKPATPFVLPVGAYERRTQAEDFVASIRSSAEPTFDFVHLLLPHQPWEFLPTGQDAGAPEEDPTLAAANVNAWGSEWATWVGRQREVLQLQMADRVISSIVSRLRAIGAWDDTMLVVTADHGAAFTVGEPIRWVKQANTGEILWTPLFVKYPGQATGRVDDRPVESIDVVPTIADVLGVRIPWPVDGVTARGEPRKEFPRRFAQWRLRSPVAPPGVPFARGNGTLRIDGSSFREVLTRQAVLGGDSGTDDPYAIGPHRDLLGQPASRYVAPGVTTAGTATIGDPTRFDRVDPTAARAPWSWIEGRVDGPDGDHPLAVAVNGTIAGLSSTDRRGAGIPGYYLVLLAPRYFRAGPNDVSVYVVSGPPTAPQLVPLTAVRS